uniref:Mannosyltransferase n=1 Tax=Ciona savignyi TaxID=51511 RepID=H2Z3F4_CIOSA
SDKLVLNMLLVLRAVNVALVQTWFVPDEYWQSIEIAHKQVFGYGYETWEWTVGLRSYLYPLLFSAVYYVPKISGMGAYAVILAPRLAQAVLSATTEWCVYRCFKRTCGIRFAKWFLLKCNLVCIALYYLSCDQFQFSYNYFKFVVVASVAFVVRPTIITVWMPLYCLYVCMNTNGSLHFGRLLSKAILIGVFVLCVSTLIDTLCYGRLVSVHYNFFKFNILQNQGTFYGSHPFHWYLTQAFPVILSTHLPFMLYGVFIFYTRTLKFKQANNVTHLCKLSAVICLFTVFVYSIPGHKEFRFLLCLLPFLHVFTSLGLLSLPSRSTKLAITWLLLTNIPIALYTGLIHQSGPSKVMEFLRKDISHSSKLEVMFLCPCHSTPYYAFINKNIAMDFLTCHPDLNATPAYTDQADEFYASP